MAYGQPYVKTTWEQKTLKCDNRDFVSIRRTSIEKHTNTKHQVCITEITKKKIYEK